MVGDAVPQTGLRLLHIQFFQDPVNRIDWYVCLAC